MKSAPIRVGEIMLRDIIHRTFGALAVVVWVVGSIWGLIASFNWLEAKIGAFWSFVALLAAPIAFPIAALWAGLFDGNWSILLIGLGSFVGGMLLGMIASMAKAP